MQDEQRRRALERVILVRLRAQSAKADGGLQSAAVATVATHPRATRGARTWSCSFSRASRDKKVATSILTGSSAAAIVPGARDRCTRWAPAARRVARGRVRLQFHDDAKPAEPQRHWRPQARLRRCTARQCRLPEMPKPLLSLKLDPAREEAPGFDGVSIGAWRRGRPTARSSSLRR